MANPIARSEEELIAGIQTVGFELRMLAHSFALLERERLDGNDAMAENAYIDSAHLHARSLIDFLLMDSRYATDIRRTDFASEWTPGPEKAIKRLKDNYPLLHKYLAHLTWERADRQAPAWNYPEIASDLIDVAAEWSRHVNKEDETLWGAFQPDVFLARKTLTGEETEDDAL